MRLALLVATLLAALPVLADGQRSDERAEASAARERRRDRTDRHDDDDPKRRPRRRPAPRAAGPVTVPIDIGVGPALLLPNPPAFASQPMFTGLSLSIAAVIDQELIREHANRIPPGMRKAARGLNEVRYRPWFLALVPELLVVSPQLEGLSSTGMYGAVWRPFGIGLTLLDEPVRVAVNGAVDVAALYLHSTTLGGGSVATQSQTVFLRPGLNLELVLEVPLTDSLLLSGGWSSDLFIPQPFGGEPWEIEPLDDALWHLGGPFLKVHVRIPYTVEL